MQLLSARHRYDRTLVLLALVGVVLATPLPCGAGSPPLQSIHSVRTEYADFAKKGKAVRIQGVVNFVDAPRHYFVEDATGGIRVRLRRDELPPARGQKVVIEATTQFSNGFVFLDTMMVTQSEAGDLCPKPVVRADLGKYAYQFVEFQGRVFNSHFSIAQTAVLDLWDEGKVLRVVIRDPSWTEKDSAAVIDTVISVKGVVQALLNPPPAQPRYDVQVVEMGHVTVVMKAPTPTPFDGPTVPIRDLYAKADHRSKVEAEIVELQSNNTVVIKDASGVARAQMFRTMLLRPKDRVHVLGFGDRVGDTTFLRMADVRVLGLPAHLSERSLSQVQADDWVPVRHSIRDVRRLSSADAAKGLPVRLRGVVTYRDLADQLLILHDGTEGIQVYGLPAHLPVKTHQLIDLEGFTQVGDLGPHVRFHKVESLGRAEMPPVKEISWNHALGGREDGHRVSLDAIVIRVVQTQPNVMLEAMTAGHLFRVIMPSVQTPLEELSRQWVDARITFHGIMSSVCNEKHQWVGVQLFVPGPDHIFVRQRPPDDPFAVEKRSIASLSQFEQLEDPGHRVKVQGVVTLIRPDQDSLFIQEGERGVWIPRAVNPWSAASAPGIASNRSSSRWTRQSASIPIAD